MSIKEAIQIFGGWGLIFALGFWIYPRYSAWTLTEDDKCWFEVEYYNGNEGEARLKNSHYTFKDDNQFSYTDEYGNITNGTWEIDAYNDSITLTTLTNGTTNVQNLKYTMRRFSGPVHCGLKGTTATGETWSVSIWRTDCDNDYSVVRWSQ